MKIDSFVVFSTRKILTSFSKLWPSGRCFPYVCLCVSVFVCVFTFEVPFKRPFASISRSRMSKVFGDSQLLGKSNGKKWSQIWKLLLKKGVKLRRTKKLAFCSFSIAKHGRHHAPWWIRDLWSKGISIILAYLYTFLSFCVFNIFFTFSKKIEFFGILGQTTVHCGGVTKRRVKN